MEISIGKANTQLAVDFDSLKDHVKDYVIRYGLTQILNDAHSSVTATEEPDATKRGEQALTLAEKKLQAMVNGEVRAFGGRTGDPVQAEANKLARNAILKALKAQGRKAKEVEPEAMRTAIAKYLAGNPKVLEIAKSNIEAAKGLDITGIEV